MDLEILSIIPARGASKGIRKKNLQLINNLPLIAHTIKHSKEANLVKRVVVSTDDEEIQEVSKYYGAEVIKRPKNISGDKHHSDLALKHVLDVLYQKERYKPDLVVFLQATSPIRRPIHIDQAINKLMEENGDTCISVLSEHFTGRWEINIKGFAEPINYMANNPIQYLENGSINVFKTENILKTGNRFGEKIVIFEMNAIESLQIDDYEDLYLVNNIMRNMYKNKNVL